MCGIIGYVGKKNSLHVLINGLKRLEYRGYDSAGVAFINKNNIEIIKEKGKVAELEKKIDFTKESNIGISHTRWATHGAANEINAHPHSCEKITLVHNGIIENYEILKKELKQKGYTFYSETDSEVVAVLLNDLYKENDIIESIIKMKKILKGSYALAILCSDYPNQIYTIRKDSPLIIAKDSEGSYVASDVPAFLEYTNKYSILAEEEIAILTKDNIEVINNKKEKITKETITFEGDINSSQKDGYDHFMLKEIFEEKDVIKRIMKDYNTFDKLIEKMKFLDKYKKFDIIACGSAYHVGVVAKYLIEEFANIPVNAEIASEYRYKNNFLDKESLAIFISQSGETADSIASLRKVKAEGIDTLGIVNVVGSSIARESDNVIYTKAGPEIAVATTKAFVAQLTIVTLMSLYLGYKNKNIKKDKVTEILKELDIIENNIDKLLKYDYKEIAKLLYKHEKIFFIGRGYDYAIALEGSLKLKEISYIHSEAYAAGELKHGTISLIEENTPVICLLTDENIIDKTISNIKEVKARGAYTIGVSNEEHEFLNNNIIIPKTKRIITPLLEVIPLQLISYEVAKLRDCDIDKPRNLAKSVTVE
ncbi:MAG: glutamine--fructose-6-phosphate transaminase (isomerizing) [Bacilli bacterium]|nr:glutamine--fructose-6-phosphate transaminase (isomerizing) [Bacilli bacterium]